MLENINYALFALLNATPASPQWAIEMAIFIAKDLILIVPLLVVTLWLWGPAQRQMVFKLMLALTISLTVSWAIGHLYPHDRPFVAAAHRRLAAPSLLHAASAADSSALRFLHLCARAGRSSAAFAFRRLAR